MRLLILNCFAAGLFAVSAAQSRAQTVPDKETLLRQLASQSTEDRERAITEILRRRDELRPWLQQQAEHAEAPVRQNINVVRKLIELGVTEKLHVQVREQVERFITGSFEQRLLIVRFLAGKRAHFILQLLVPEIATTVDDRQREKLWRAVIGSLHRDVWSRGRAALCGTMIVEIVEESDDRVRQAIAGELLQAYNGSTSGELADWILKHDEIDSLMAMLELTDSYRRFDLLASIVKALDCAEHEDDRKRGLEFWKLAVPDNHLGGESLAKALLLSKWFRADLLRRDPSDPVAPLVKDMQDGFLVETLEDAFMEGMAIEMVKHDQFALFEPLMRHVPEDKRHYLLNRIGRLATFRRGLHDRQDMIRTLQAFYRVKDASLRKDLAEYAVCGSDVSRHGDVLIRYLQAVAKDDPELESRFCVQMFRQPNIDRIAADSPLLQTLVGVIKRPDADLLARLLAKGSSGPFLMAKAGHGREIIDAVSAVSDPKDRLPLQRQLLSLSPLQQLMTAEEISVIFRRLLNDPLRDQHIELLLTSRDAVRKLIELGEFEKLRELADAQKPPWSDGKARWDFYSHSSTIAELKARGEMAKLLVDIIDNADVDLRRHIRYMLGYMGGDALKWMLDDDHWDDLKKYFSQRDQIGLLASRGARDHYVQQKDLSLLNESIEMFNAERSKRNAFYLNLVYSPGFDEALRSKRFAHQLAEIVVNEKDPRLKETLASNRGHFLEALWRGGRFDDLVRMAEKCPANDHRQREYYVSAIRQSVSEQMRNQKFETATSQLLALARIAPNEVNRPLFLRTTGGLDAEIAEQKTRIVKEDNESEDNESEDNESESLSAQRDLLRLLRAAESRQAVEVAKNIDPTLAWLVAVEQFDWNTASQLPLPPVAAKTDSTHRKLIENCLRYTIHSLAGERQERDGDRARLLNWLDQNANDGVGIQLACDTLLANESREIALELIKTHIPQDHGFWFSLEHDRRPAMEIVRRQRGDLNGLFDRLAANTEYPGSERMMAAGQLFGVGSEWTRQGNSDLWASICRCLEDYPRRANLDRSQRDAYYVDLATRYDAGGHKRRAWKLVASTLTGEKPPSSFFQRVYTDTKNPLIKSEASSWWRLCAKSHPEDSLLDRLERVDRIVTGVAPIDVVESILLTPPEFPDNNPLQDLFGNRQARMKAFQPMGTFMRYGLIDPYLERVDEKKHFSRDELAVLAYDAINKDDHRRAADYFLQAWRWKPKHGWITHPLPRASFHLYMAGVCQGRLHPAVGAETKTLARQLAFSNKAARNLADRLFDEGLGKDAAKVYTDLMLSISPRGRSYMDVVSKTSGCLPETQRAKHFHLLRLLNQK